MKNVPSDIGTSCSGSPQKSKSDQFQGYKGRFLSLVAFELFFTKDLIRALGDVLKNLRKGLKVLTHMILHKK